MAAIKWDGKKEEEKKTCNNNSRTKLRNAVKPGQNKRSIEKGTCYETETSVTVSRARKSKHSN